MQCGALQRARCHYACAGACAWPTLGLCLAAMLGRRYKRWGGLPTPERKGRPAAQRSVMGCIRPGAPRGGLDLPQTLPEPSPQRVSRSARARTCPISSSQNDRRLQTCQKTARDAWPVGRAAKTPSHRVNRCADYCIRGTAEQPRNVWPSLVFLPCTARAVLVFMLLCVIIETLGMQSRNKA